MIFGIGFFRSASFQLTAFSFVDNSYDADGEPVGKVNGLTLILGWTAISVFIERDITK